MNNPEPARCMVTILCLTYNQKEYIQDCLDGFVCQQTTFPFRAIVHDDASTDGTIDIIREYAERYPDIIVPVIEEKNLFSQKAFDVLLRKIAPFVMQGRYMATCEGDDYWTDPMKLQRQVDFMEAHPDFAICYHDVMDLNIRTSEQRRYDYSGKDIPIDADIHDLCRLNFYMRTCTTLYRTSALDMEQLIAMMPVLNIDIIMQHQAALHGRIHRLTELMAVFRMGSGIWNGTDGYDATHFASSIKAATIIQSLMPTPELKADIERVIEWNMQQYDQYQQELRRYIHALETGRPRQLGLWLLHPLNMLRSWFNTHFSPLQ